MSKRNIPISIKILHKTVFFIFLFDNLLLKSLICQKLQRIEVQLFLIKILINYMYIHTDNRKIRQLFEELEDIWMNKNYDEYNS